jgi:hypothetical protein
LLVWYICSLVLLLASGRGRQALLWLMQGTFWPTVNDQLVARLVREQDHRRGELRRRYRRRRRIQRGRRGGNGPTGDAVIGGDDDHDDDDDDGVGGGSTDAEEAPTSWFHFWSGPPRFTVGPTGSGCLSEFPYPSKELLLRTKRYRCRRQECRPSTKEAGAADTVAEGDNVVVGEDDNEAGGGNKVDPDHDATHCCAICIVDLEDGDRIGDLPCRHLYHVSCLKRWIGHRNSCPLCSSPMATVDAL